MILITVLLTTVTSLPGQPDSQDQRLTILEYGFPRTNEYRNAQATVGERWAIEFRSVAGCMVTQEIIDSVAQHNEQSHTQIIDKFGPDWREKFNKEVEVELVIQLQVRELIDSVRFIQQLDSTLGTKGNGLHYLLTQAGADLAYSVQVFGWGDWNGQSELLQYYLLQVDLKSETVEIENDVAELFNIE